MNGSSEWLSLGVVMQLYGVDLDWLQQAAQLGVLRSLQRHADAWQIAAAELDRVATAVRWNRHLGLELEVVAVLIDEHRH